MCFEDFIPHIWQYLRVIERSEKSEYLSTTGFPNPFHTAKLFLPWKVVLPTHALSLKAPTYEWLAYPFLHSYPTGSSLGETRW